MKTVLCIVMLIIGVRSAHAWDNADSAAAEELRQLKAQMQYQQQVEQIRYNEQRAWQQPQQQLNPAIILQGQNPNLMDNYYRAYDAARR